MKSLILIGSSALCALGLFIAQGSSEILFESLESKTFDEGPVFNKVQFIPGWDKDVWLMNQAPNGLHGTWDQLEIVVDKTKIPKEAKFYQRGAPYKARCFACHANGPRAIRYNADSTEAVPNLIEKLRVAIWNLRIKSYGPVDSIAGQPIEEGHSFKSPVPVFAQPLRLPTCQMCHSADGIRNELKLEQIGTAHFLVKNGLMPPFPFKATAEEIRKLEQFDLSPK